jgi:hypothetical protein
MAGLLGSVGFIRGCGGALAFEMTPVAITPTAHSISGEGKIMRAARKRAVIAAAGLTAAGLFGSLPYDGSPLAQQGAPVQHHDVALVDVTSPIVASEVALDDSLYSGLYGSTTGLYAELYNNTVTALGATTADSLLGTTVAGGADGIFDGAANSFSSGVFLDTWAAEDELNQLLGVTATASETAILADIGTDPVALAGDTLPTAGATGFDADLMTIATADFTNATSEFTSYLDGLPTALGDLGSLSGLLGDLGLGSLGDGVGGLGTDLTTLLDGLLGSL